MMRTAINAIIIKNHRILLVRKQNVWILPGGKPDPGETDLDCLHREMGEELPKFTMGSKLRFLGEFIGTTPHQGDELCARAYLVDGKGKTTPGAEIAESKWTDKPEKYNLSDITEKIVHFLRKKYLL